VLSALLLFYSHPAVYIMIVPAFGVIGEIIPVFSRNGSSVDKFIANHSLGHRVPGFLVWGHNVRQRPVVLGALSSAPSLSDRDPDGHKVFNWITTMYKGVIHLDTPMLYALAFCGCSPSAGLTGIFLP